MPDLCPHDPPLWRGMCDWLCARLGSLDGEGRAFVVTLAREFRAGREPDAEVKARLTALVERVEGE